MDKSHAESSLVVWVSQAALLGLLWVLFTGKVEWQELGVGAVCFALAFVALLKVHALHFAPFQPRGKWLSHVLSLPVQVLKDSLTVISALGKKGEGPEGSVGKFSTAHFNGGKDDATSSARRAAAIGLTSFPPNSIMVEISREEDTILYHELVPQGSTPEPAKSLGEE